MSEPAAFVNPRVAAKHKKREENKLKAIEKAKREKANKELKRALSQPEKLFEELKETKNLLRIERDALEGMIEAVKKSAARAENLVKQLEAKAVTISELKTEIKNLNLAVQLGKEMLDYNQRRAVQAVAISGPPAAVKTLEAVKEALVPEGATVTGRTPTEPEIQRLPRPEKPEVLAAPIISEKLPEPISAGSPETDAMEKSHGFQQ